MTDEDRNEARASAERPMTEDEKVFGRETFVYCSKHRMVHTTGWCSVGAENKVGLGLLVDRTDSEAATKKAEEKCVRLGLLMWEVNSERPLCQTCGGRGRVTVDKGDSEDCFDCKGTGLTPLPIRSNPRRRRP